MKGLIFDIKEFALNDGDGIRTTIFMKGCPLRCIWCHNPEGLSAGKELYVKNAGCIKCGLCYQECHHEECRPYGRCLHICPRNLISLSGTEWESEDLANKLLKHREFFSSTGGGITFSGGEPLMQADFCVDVLKKLNGKIHRTVETSGFANPKIFENLISNCDFVIMDIKLADPDKHIEYTGVPLEPILKNALYLKKSGIRHLFRTPLIPDITDTTENLSRISEIIGDAPIELLPYNRLAGAKYDGLGLKFTDRIDESRANNYDHKHILSLFNNAKIKK